MTTDKERRRRWLRIGLYVLIFATVGSAVMLVLAILYGDRWDVVIAAVVLGSSAINMANTIGALRRER